MIAPWSWIATIFRRLSFRAHRASLNEELRDEMQFHIDMLARDNEARGMPRDVALEAAKRQFGSATMLREASRSHWSLGWIDAISQDVRYGIRSLIRTRGVTVTALLTLALGIGATVMVVALVDATLLHPIALRDVDRIVTICQTNAGPSCAQLATGNYVSVKNAPTALQDAALMQYWSATVSGRVGTTVALGALVTPNYLSVLGVTPFLGRSFTRADADASASQPAVVILSYGFWRSNFNADPGIIGHSAEIGGVPVTVIGVLRKDDGFPAGVDMWGPLQLTASAAADRESENSMVFGRLRPGATVADAARDVSAVQQQLIRESPSTNAGWRFVTAPLRQFRVADYRSSVLLITAAVIGVLLIACANVGNLQLVRTLAREREVAVRAALGAGRAQLARQLMIEGLLLAVAGGAAGVMVGEFGLVQTKRMVPAYLSALMPGLNTMSINWRVLALTFGICIAIGVGLSAFPAFRAARTDLTGALKQGARGSTTGRKVARVRTALVVSEIALAVMLVTGAGLLIQSFTKLSAANTGLRSDHVLTMHLTVPGTFDETHLETYHHMILRRLETLPGVRSAALVNLLPLSGHNVSNNFIPDTRPALQIMRAPSAHEEAVSSAYFAVMGVPLLRGRIFTDADQDTAAHVVIVNSTLANRYWPNGEAVGHTIRTNDRGTQYTIIGVVGDVHYSGADKAATSEVYHPAEGRLWNADAAVRTIGDPGAATQEIIRATRAIDPSVAITRVVPMDVLVARQYAFYGILAKGLITFALIALIIASAGVYGVVAYGVSQRTQEIGVRMALGAKYQAVVRMVMVEGARLAAIGVALGIIGAWFAGNALAFLLYGVAPRDPVTLITVALILAAVALAASYFPARRAGRVEPVIALRSE